MKVVVSFCLINIISIVSTRIKAKRDLSCPVDYQKSCYNKDYDNKTFISNTYKDTEPCDYFKNETFQCAYCDCKDVEEYKFLNVFLNFTREPYINPYAGYMCQYYNDS